MPLDGEGQHWNLLCFTLTREEVVGKKKKTKRGRHYIFTKLSVLHWALMQGRKPPSITRSTHQSWLALLTVSSTVCTDQCAENDFFRDRTNYVWRPRRLWIVLKGFVSSTRAPINNWRVCRSVDARGIKNRKFSLFHTATMIMMSIRYAAHRKYDTRHITRSKGLLQLELEKKGWACG